MLHVVNTIMTPLCLITMLFRAQLLIEVCTQMYLDFNYCLNTSETIGPVIIHLNSTVHAL